MIEKQKLANENLLNPLPYGQRDLHYTKTFFSTKDDKLMIRKILAVTSDRCGVCKEILLIQVFFQAGYHSYSTRNNSHNLSMQFEIKIRDCILKNIILMEKRVHFCETIQEYTSGYNLNHQGKIKKSESTT